MITRMKRKRRILLQIEYGHLAIATSFMTLIYFCGRVDGIPVWITALAMATMCAVGVTLFLTETSIGGRRDNNTRDKEGIE